MFCAVLPHVYTSLEQVESLQMRNCGVLSPETETAACVSIPVICRMFDDVAVDGLAPIMSVNEKAAGSASPVVTLHVSLSVPTVTVVVVAVELTPPVVTRSWRY